jgi:hypothetical protein|tara:strand:- start:136 stop:717 length:582 start_codon:yes stop_codon:yes gene_type:complete
MKSIKKKKVIRKKSIKKKKMVVWMIIFLVIVIVIKFLIMLNEYEPEKEDLGLAVKMNIDGDFPNPKEGTAIFNVRLVMDQIINNFNKVPKYILFAESQAIPGLVLRYNVHDSVLEGGLPLIKSKEIVFLDNNVHEILYTFKEGAEQKFFFDRKEVASGIFDSGKIGITGFAVDELQYDVEIMDFGSVEFDESS